MDRRTLLAGIASAGSASIAGCLGAGGNQQPGGSENGDGDTGDDDSSPGSDDGSADQITPTGGSASSPPENCGPADQPLSERLVDDPGEQDACFDGATPDIAAMNERDDPVNVELEIDGDDALQAEFELDPGERVREPNAVVASDDVTGTITVDGEAIEVRWPTRACNQHGLAIVSGGLEIGWLKPVRGIVDTQHDCYPGDPASVRVGSTGGDHEVTVTVENRCEGTTDSRTIELDGTDSEQLGGLLESGGVYDVTVAVEGGETATHEFHDACWGVTASIDEAGDITAFHQTEID